MQYISDIGGLSYICDWLSDVDNIPVTVHDTVSGQDSIENAAELQGSEVLGVGTFNQRLLVVRHTIKTATLHNHVVGIDATNGTCPGACPQGDYAIVAGGTLAQWTNGSDDHKTISINNMDNGPDVAGFLGSVVYYVERVTPVGRLCTLYDYLFGLSKAIGRNLFSYRTVHVFSDLSNTSMIVKLAESAEASRFATKVYLDLQKEN